MIDLLWWREDMINSSTSGKFHGQRYVIYSLLLFGYGRDMDELASTTDGDRAPPESDRCDPLVCDLDWVSRLIPMLFTHADSSSSGHL